MDGASLKSLVYSKILCVYIREGVRSSLSNNMLTCCIVVPLVWLFITRWKAEKGSDNTIEFQLSELQ